MIKKSYYLNTEDAATIEAMDTIIQSIPCFVWEDNGETVIECRAEDAAFVEKALAPVV